MGSDKALFRIEGEAMISRIANALSSANLEPIRVAVSRPEDVEYYGAEIQGDIDKLRGFDISFVTSPNTSDEEAYELLHLLGMPFRKN